MQTTLSDKYVPGRGPVSPQIMIVGEAPSYVEVDKGIPFTGNSGRELDKMLKDVGINRSECWLTNVCKYMIPENPKGKRIPFATRAKSVGIDVEKQLEELQVEINDVKPNVIIALGGTALWALASKSPISKFRGSIMLGMGRKMVPTYHPAHLLHQAAGEIKGYWNKFVILHDLQRAKVQSRFPDIRPPLRTLAIAKDSAQFADFIQRHTEYDKLSVDIEARGSCIPVCIGLSFRPEEGLTIPLWNSEGISTIPDSDLVQCWRMLAHLLWEKKVVGQNFNYDRDKIRRLGFAVKSLASDTMLKAFCINPELPKNLAFNTSIYTEEPFYKDEGMYEGSIENLLLGCARDACVTFEVDRNMDPDVDELGLRDFYENYLMRLPDLYRGIENQGFRVDEEKREELFRKYIAWSELLHYKLYAACGAEINVNSPKQVNILLYENLKLPRKKGTGEEELTKLLKSPKVDEFAKNVIGLILEKRRVDKSIGTYLMALPDFDGRMRTTYFPCLETGRSSTGQQDPPIRPTVEVRDWNNKKKKRVLGTAFQTITKHGDIGADVRSMYIPDEGDVFLQADSSQAEARVIAVLAGDEEMLRMYDEHDVHALTASWFFGGSESDYSKKILGYEVPERFGGKTLRHAGHLGAGKSRAATELNTQARKYGIKRKDGTIYSISEAEANRALNIFHMKSPNIRGTFHAEIIEVLKNNKRRIVAPRPSGIKSNIGGIRTFYERWGDELFRQAFSYIPQRAVSDNTKVAALRIKARIPTIKIVLEAHDGLLFSVPEDRVHTFAPIIREEMERPIDFTQCSLKRGFLSIPCDVEIGPNYQQLEKFSLKAA